MSSAPSTSSSTKPQHHALPYIVLGIIAPIAMILALMPVITWIGHIPNGMPTPPWSPSDFGMFWASGHFANSASPADVYSTMSMYSWKCHHIPGPHHTDPFVYPPPSLLLTQLLDLSGYWRAYLGWTAGLTAMSIAVLRTARVPWVAIGFAILTPASLYNMLLGQFSALSSCFFVASLLLVDDSPALSGIFVGLTLLKPQMALLAPIAIVARRRWPGVISGLLVVFLLCGLTTVLFGIELWSGYFSRGLMSSRTLLDLPYPRPRFSPQYRGGYEYDQISVFYMLRSFGLSATIAMVGQAISAAFACFACWQLWQRANTDPIVRAAITIFLALLVTPYGFPQDMVAYSLGLILLVWRRGALEVWDVILLMWPALLGFVSMIMDRSITPVIILWALARAFRMLRQFRSLTMDAVAS